jgi:hypothetical protein
LITLPPAWPARCWDALISVLGSTVTGGRIAEVDMVADPAKLRHLALQP